MLNLPEDTLAATVEWFDRAIPAATRKQIAIQIGVHCEETVEFLETLSGDEDPELHNLLHKATIAMHELANRLKESTDEVVIINHVHCLDALCDMTVTAAGTGTLLGYDIVGAMQEVNESNFSKFVNGKPIFNEFGKIAKGPHTRKPNLLTFI